MLNIQTVLAIHRAVRFHEKADFRYLTVADVDSRRGAVVKVPLGMRLFDMLDALRQRSPFLARSLNPARVFAGGGVMQAWHADESDIVDESVNFVGSGKMPRFKESPQCSRCGRCEQVCPVHLPVAELVRLTVEIKRGRWRRSTPNAAWLVAVAVWFAWPVRIWPGTCDCFAITQKQSSPFARMAAVQETTISHTLMSVVNVD